MGRVPSRERVRGNHTSMFLSLSFSLPSPLSKSKYIKSLKKNYGNWLSKTCASPVFCSCLNHSSLPSMHWISTISKYLFLPPPDWSSLRGDTTSFVTILPSGHRVVDTEGNPKNICCIKSNLTNRSLSQQLCKQEQMPLLITTGCMV